MNWKCLIKHNWVYSVEDVIEYEGSDFEIPIKTNVRFCDKCHRKQKSKWHFINLKQLSDRDWVDLKSKQEERDIKLRKLGL